MPDDRQWQIQERGRVSTIGEAQLRARLRAGKLSGLEAVRPEGEQVWAPLHALPLFAVEVPVHGDPLREAHRRAVSRWLSHVVIFGGVCGALTVGAGHFPICGLYWLIPVAFHTISALPSVLALLDRAPAARSAPEASPDPLAASESAAAELSKLLEDLAWYADPDQIAALDAEEHALRARIVAEADPRIAEALERQHQALVDRRALSEEARLTVARLRAERDALQHQVEGLRAGWLVRRAREGEDR